MIQALHWLLDLQPLYAAIFTDSLSSLSALINWTPKDANVYLLEVLSLVRELTLFGVHVEFIWIPAHVGISGNERADAVAKGDVIGPSLSTVHYFFLMSKLERTVLFVSLGRLFLIAPPKDNFIMVSLRLLDIPHQLSLRSALLQSPLRVYDSVTPSLISPPCRETFILMAYVHLVECQKHQPTSSFTVLAMVMLGAPLQTFRRRPPSGDRRHSGGQGGRLITPSALQRATCGSERLLHTEFASNSYWRLRGGAPTLCQPRLIGLGPPPLCQLV